MRPATVHRFPDGVHLIGARNAAATHREQAAAFYEPLIPVVVELRRQGMSLRQIATELERRGVPTRQEFNRWHGRQVARILARAEVDGVS